MELLCQVVTVKKQGGYIIFLKYFPMNSKCTFLACLLSFCKLSPFVSGCCEFSGDYSLEGSSDGNNQKVLFCGQWCHDVPSQPRNTDAVSIFFILQMSGTPKKRNLDDRTTSGTLLKYSSTHHVVHHHQTQSIYIHDNCIFSVRRSRTLACYFSTYLLNRTNRSVSFNDMSKGPFPPLFCSETCGVSATNDKPGESGRLPTLSSVHIPDATMKPCVSTGSDFKVSGATSTEWPAKVCLT